MERIDVDFNFFEDTPPGKDPDSYSPTLRRYHQLLWSKPLPSGRSFELQAGRAKSPYLTYESNGTRYVLASDTIASRHRKALSGLFEQVPDEVNESFLRRSYTICGFMIFPMGRPGQSLNQARGVHPSIRDRWDLTLEAIRRFYEGETSPLSRVLDNYADYFELFESFQGFVSHFLLDDFLDGHGDVRFLLPFHDFSGPALPGDLESYLDYRSANLALFEARRDRIAAAVAG